MRYLLLLVALITSTAFATPDFDETMVAAKQGAAAAQFNLGNMYDEGRGVPQNDGEAVKWFRKAADQGYAKAQYNLALVYYSGEGVPENNIRAYVWLSMAIDNHT